MKWKEVKITDIKAKTAHALSTGPFGSSISAKFFQDEGVPVIRGSNLSTETQVRLSEEGLTFISPELAKTFERSSVKNGDLIFTCWGTINQIGLIDERATYDEYIVSNKQMKLTPDQEKASSLFLYYYFSTYEVQQSILARNIGSSVPGFNLGQLKEFKVILPPLPTQQKIASILSAYDDAIENNLRRIRLLEEAAQHLYREWFVRFRFPGWEEVKVVEGLPEGWERKVIKDFGEVITGKTPSTENHSFFGGEIPFVKTPDMHGNTFVISTSTTLTVAGAESQKNKYLPPFSVMISCIGTAGVVSLAANTCQTNQQINSIVLDQDYKSFYAYFFSKGLKEHLEGLGSNGATFVNVNKNKFENIELIVPLEELLIEFGRIAKPIFSQILTLQRQSQHLKSARDLLLPRLMNQTIEV